MTKLLTTIAAATLLMSGAAFAQDSDGGNDVPAVGQEEFPYSSEDYDANIIDFFADESGMMRTEEDFSSRLAEATPDQMKGMGSMCDDVLTQQEVSAGMTSRCDMVKEKMDAM